MDDSNDRLLALLAREGKSLHALLNRLTLDPHAAEDLLQDLFVNVCQSRGFHAANKPAAYLRQAAIHLAFAWRRQRKRPADAAATRDIELPDNQPPADAAAMQREQWERILDAAESLAGLSREVFVLQFLQGQSVEEIAAHLGKTPHQVRALASKALTQVRGYVKASEDKEQSHVRR